MQDTPSAPDDARIAEELLQLLRARGPDRSICPSEVARALGPEWRSLMTRVRRVAVALARDGRLEVLRKGKPVPAENVKGVIRLRLARLETQA